MSISTYETNQNFNLQIKKRKKNLKKNRQIKKKNDRVFYITVF